MFLFFTKLFNIKYSTKFDENFNKQSSWYDIWNDSDIKPLTFQELTSSLVISGTNFENVYIKNSFFQQITSNLHGGAISYYGSSRKRLLVEQSTFIECHSLSGSGIYFDYGDYYLNEICGLNCSSESTIAGVFGNFNVQEDICKGTIVNSAFCFCNSLNWGFTIAHFYGDFSFNLNNESFNHCYRGSAFGIDHASSNYIKLSYSSFTNATSDESTCVVFEYSNTYFEVSYSNIINNKVNNNSNGLIWFLSIENGATFTSCSILENKGYPIFNSNTNEIVTLNYCYTDFPQDDDQLIHCSIIVKNIPEMPFVNNFNNVILGNCVGISLNTNNNKEKPPITYYSPKMYFTFHKSKVFF